MKKYEFETDEISFTITRDEGRTKLEMHQMDDDLRGEGILHELNDHELRSESLIAMERTTTYFPGTDEDDGDTVSYREDEITFQQRLSCIREFMRATYGWGKIERNIPWL